MLLISLLSIQLPDVLTADILFGGLAFLWATPHAVVSRFFGDGHCVIASQICFGVKFWGTLFEFSFFPVAARILVEDLFTHGYLKYHGMTGIGWRLFDISEIA